MTVRPGRPERERGAPIVDPKPAATVVVLRPAADGFEVLLTRRAAAMRFGADMYVFPGGRLDPDDADHRAAAVRETLEETGIELDAEGLIPLSRWVTPPGLPSRFDARFFAALVGPATDVAAASAEVADWRWLRPTDALAAGSAGELEMWQPTVVTLQQLEGLRDRAGIEAAFAPDPDSGATDGVGFELVARGLHRVRQPWAGGIEGRSKTGWLVGEREWVFVNPADPTGETIAATVARAEARGATLVGVAITDLLPAHHAGVEMLAAGLGLPVAAGPSASEIAPYPVIELRDGDRVPFGDVPLTARTGPALDDPAARPERVSYEGPGWRLPDRG
ncbi:MAG TPA: NUDIX domain-containing protein [Candidatus Eisenbacteria bacterium]|nr:NUDIX domain-containing protein [Candidatus Eisenbacteria bacterium]